jgi:hypothetical protein
MQFLPRPTLVSVALVAALLAFGTPAIGHAAARQPISRTTVAGPYTVTLKVLPAESFTGPGAEMAWVGGAKPQDEGSPARPNHHLVERGEKPVEDARVEIAYERRAPQASWTELPVARMHVAGKGAATTHYGNNVKLEPGSYRVRVTVGGKDTATFEFTIPS